ncbi:MAG: ribonuclease H family protein, partial [Pseudomonadota bacterium]
MIGYGSKWPDPEKTSAVQQWPPLTSLAQVRSFLGFLTFVRPYIRDFSRIATPLTQLTKKGVTFDMNHEQNKAFAQLKQALANEPVLRLPDFNRPFILYTDASNVGTGAILTQQFQDGLHPVAYASHKFNTTEQNYSTYEQELSAIVLAIRKFQ